MFWKGKIKEFSFCKLCVPLIENLTKYVPHMYSLVSLDGFLFLRSQTEEAVKFLLFFFPRFTLLFPCFLFIIL